MIPQELMAYPQWVLWRSALTTDNRPTKLPYSPITGQLASVNDPRTWSDYPTAVTALSFGQHTGLGFVLSTTDPYTFIDLDDPKGDQSIIDIQVKIEESFDSYSEVSPSGRGLHIIIKGNVPEGRRRSCVEVYSSSRYMTMTGNTYHEKPIADRQSILETLWEELGSNKSKLDIASQPQQYADDEIYYQAWRAENGDKFAALWRGDWNIYYKSQSEADFALINILGFYSRNIDQIRRLFLTSALGQRDKSRKRVKTYVDNMIKRSFDNLPPAVDLESMVAKIKSELQVNNPFAGPLFQSLPDPNYDWTVPPGLLGDIVQFIYASAPRPVKEVALAAGIGFMAGICGRAYNVSKTGLNQYVLVLAKTGIGKEAMAAGIDKLVKALRPSIPAIMDFIGPAEIASGIALIKQLNKQPCFVSVVGEFGLLMQQICSPSANLPQQQLRRKLLELYNKSGATDTVQPTIYSDQNNNTKEIKSPAFTLLGESTPEAYYAGIDETMIAQGLLPRFLCIEYLGPRPPLNKQHGAVTPSPDLLARLTQLLMQTLALGSTANVHEILCSPEAEVFLDKFELSTTDLINSSDQVIARELWNRAHIKSLKLAALIAIGINSSVPVISLECAEWATTLVERDILNVLAKFEAGGIGRDTNEIHQLADVAYIIKDYISKPFTHMGKYRIVEQMHTDRVIETAYIQRRLLAKNAFKNDHIGASNAINRALQSLVNEGSIREVNQASMYKAYNKTSKGYLVVDPMRFLKSNVL
jgi:hypothetical protein